MGEETIEVGFLANYTGIIILMFTITPYKFSTRVTNIFAEQKKMRRENSYSHKLQKYDLEETFWCTNTSACYHHDYESATRTTKYIRQHHQA